MTTVPDIQANDQVTLRATVELADGREVRAVIEAELVGPNHSILLGLKVRNGLTGRDITGLLSDASLASITETVSQVVQARHGMPANGRTR